MDCNIVNTSTLPVGKVISIANIPVPLAKFGERIAALVSMDEASGAIIAYELAAGRTDRHHVEALVSKSVECVRRNEPDARLEVTVDYGLEFMTAMSNPAILRRLEVARYRAPIERWQLRWVPVLTKYMLEALDPLRGPRGKLKVLSRVELEWALENAIHRFNAGAAARPPMREQVERMFRAELVKATSSVPAIA